jgi:hypothetical protein
MSVDPMSERARELLLHYRDAESLGGAERARLLQALQRSIAGGQVAGGRGEGGPAGGGAHGALAKVMAGIGPKIVLGALVIAAPAAWGVRFARETGAPAVASARAPGGERTSVIARAPAAAAVQASPWLPVIGWADGTVPTPVAALPTAGSSESRQSVTLHVTRVPRAPASFEHGVSARPRALEPAAAPMSTSVDVAPTEKNLLAPPQVAPPLPTGAVAVEAVAPSAPGSGVDEEVRLLGLAYAQLRSGQPSLALATIAEQERRFPNGKLAESRQIARILALCDSGQRSAARSEGAQFLAAHPGSPFSNRVHAVCTE